MHYKITVNGKTSHEVVIEGNGKNISLDGREIQPILTRINETTWNVLNNNNSYLVELANLSADGKHLHVIVNGRKNVIEIKDRYDELLKSLGMESLADDQHYEIRAPMPGMVLEVLKGAGEKVEKGDALLILEAMKMENVLKAPGPGIISRVLAHKGQAVEKNALLIEFEAIRTTK